MAALQRFALISLLAWSVAAALPQVPEETDTIIIKLAEGGDQPGAGGFAVASAADDDSAATLGKHIGHRLHRLRAQPGESVQQALTRVRAMKGVEYAFPDLPVYRAEVDASEGGAAYPQRVPGSTKSYKHQWAAPRIGMPAAWGIATGAQSKEAAVTVCIVDSGVDYKHPDIQPNLAKGVGFNAVDGEPEKFVADGMGHGTMVAGVIAAAGVDGGAVGVNWDNINLLSCRFMSPLLGFGRTSDAIQCLDYCLEQGARIIHASWTTGAEANLPLQEAVGRVDKAGALFVVSSGNQGVDLKQTPFYPQSYSRLYDNVLVVGATDEYDDHAPFSNFDARTVHLSAPGFLIFTTAMGGGYTYASGTSIAAPFVTGAAALLQAVAQDKLGKSLSAAELKSLLVENAEAMPWLQGRSASGGRLRVDWALQALLGRKRSPRTPCMPRPGQSKAKKCGAARNRGLAEQQAQQATAPQSRPAAAQHERSALQQAELAAQQAQQRLHHLQQQPVLRAEAEAAASVDAQRPAATGAPGRRLSRLLHNAHLPDF